MHVHVRDYRHRSLSTGRCSALRLRGGPAAPRNAAAARSHGFPWLQQQRMHGRTAPGAGGTRTISNIHAQPIPRCAPCLRKAKHTPALRGGRVRKRGRYVRKRHCLINHTELDHPPHANTKQPQTAIAPAPAHCTPRRCVRKRHRCWQPERCEVARRSDSVPLRRPLRCNDLQTQHTSRVATSHSLKQGDLQPRQHTRRRLLSNVVLDYAPACPAARNRR